MPTVTARNMKCGNNIKSSETLQINHNTDFLFLNTTIEHGKT
jgi:hypothetical protein